VDKESPAFIQTWVSLVGENFLPFHAKVCIEGKEEGVQEFASRQIGGIAKR